MTNLSGNTFVFNPVPVTLVTYQDAGSTVAAYSPHELAKEVPSITLSTAANSQRALVVGFPRPVRSDIILASAELLIAASPVAGRPKMSITTPHSNTVIPYTYQQGAVEHWLDVRPLVSDELIYDDQSSVLQFQVMVGAGPRFDQSTLHVEDATIRYSPKRMLLHYLLKGVSAGSRAGVKKRPVPRQGIKRRR